MNVLIAHGSGGDRTAGAASRISRRLADLGLEPTSNEARKVVDPARYDAVVLGSEICGGRWLGDCVGLLKRLAHDDYSGPVWLFHIGAEGAEDDCRKLPPRAVVYADRLDVRDWAIVDDVPSRNLGSVTAEEFAEEIADALRDEAAA